MPFDRLPDSIELEDAILMLTAGVGSLVVTGAATVTIGETGLSEVLFELGGDDEEAGYEITYAFAMAFLSFVVAYLTNEPDWGDLSNEETYAVVAGLVALVGVEYIGAVQDFIVGDFVFELIASAVIVAAYLVIAYHGRGLRSRMMG